MAAPKHMTAEQRIERARTAGKAAQSPEGLAQRLVKNWPKLTPAQEATIRTALRPYISGGKSSSDAA